MVQESMYNEIYLIPNTKGGKCMLVSMVHHLFFKNNLKNYFLIIFL